MSSRPLSLFALLLAALVGGLVVWQALVWLEERAPPQAVPRLVTPAGDLAADEKSTIELFERAKTSVVFITTTRQVLNPWTRNPLEMPRGAGSGFFWDDQGHLVTNYHVIAGASTARVRLNDGREYPARLVGASPAHDLAVLRIDVARRPPPPVAVGSDAQLRVGQKVLAIGNPFGLDWSLTTGVVSALDRSLPAEDGSVIEHLIQTDAAINPGNSGGPLLDSSGRLIGVNTAIFSPSGAYAGVGFAVPVDTVNRVVPQLISRGKYVRPDIGIKADDEINTVITRELGLEGVVVLGVAPGSPAAAAGLRPARLAPDGRFNLGDIITGINGKDVDDTTQLANHLAEYEIGEVVQLEVIRDGRELEVPVRLQAGS